MPGDGPDKHRAGSSAAAKAAGQTPGAQQSATGSQQRCRPSPLRSLTKAGQLFRSVGLLGLLVLTTPTTADAQITFTLTNFASFSAPPTGVAASSNVVVVSGNVGTQEYDPTTLALGRGYANSGGVTDLGLSADGLKTIELKSNGAFNIFPDSRDSIGGGNINGANSAVAWGVSNSFLVGGSEYLWIGYTDLSANKSVGLYNLTGSAFLGASFTFTSAQTPSGLGNYFLAGGSALADQRLLVSFSSNNTFIQFTPGGTAEDSYFWAGSAGDLQDIAVLTDGSTSAILYGASKDSGTGILESGAFTIGAVPEPSTYAALAGLAALGFAAYRRRKQA